MKALLPDEILYTRLFEAHQLAIEQPRAGVEAYLRWQSRDRCYLHLWSRDMPAGFLDRNFAAPRVVCDSYLLNANMIGTKNVEGDYESDGEGDATTCAFEHANLLIVNDEPLLLSCGYNTYLKIFVNIFVIPNSSGLCPGLIH